MQFFFVVTMSNQLSYSYNSYNNLTVITIYFKQITSTAFWNYKFTATFRPYFTLLMFYIVYKLYLFYIVYPISYYSYSYF